MVNMSRTTSKSIIPIEQVAAKIHVVRNENVMLDSALAELYGVETGHLVRAMKRNEDTSVDTLI